MASSGPLLTRIIATSVNVATKAGRIVRDVMNKGDFGIVDKGKNDLQTEADRSAQSCIVSCLNQFFPEVTIIGEEGPTHSEVPYDWILTDLDQDILNIDLPSDLKNIKPEQLTIWVDPLDGTSEYTQGLVEHVTVLIGVAFENRAVAGVIHQPFFINECSGSLGRTVWGIDGYGVRGFKPAIPPPGKKIITTTRSHCDNNVRAALESFNPEKILRVGGAGFKVMLLLEGKAHAYVFASGGCKKWDTCAPEAILHAAGGFLTDCHGNRYSYNKSVNYPNKGGVLATAIGENHDWWTSGIPNEIKQRLI